ncbi:MAG: M56 family metallopeptidase, partial [Clostridiales bacterium]|nr:M56 family metallopeptidase [Clostridiales bacterium]
MNEAIKLILSLSLSASILFLLILAVKPFMKHRLSKTVQYYIWIVVILRLVVPFSFENSIINDVFYNEEKPAVVISNNDLEPIEKTDAVSINSSSSTKPNAVYNNDIDHSRYFNDLFNRYVMNIWLLGVIIVLTVNIYGYIRFLKYLRKGYKPVKDIEKILLSTLLKGRRNVRLLRNEFISTPMLIGIIRPCIIIPDGDFDEVQLKNILLHEITHLNHFDVGIKWLTMIATSIHWFNPLMHFIRKEINKSCELACDEKVIKNFTQNEKQVYGDTLISFAENQKYPIGVLQVTMCEEKKSLKERLVAIMKHNRKSKLIIAFSVILLASVVLGALYLGGGIGSQKNIPPDIYISSEREETKVALMGTYSWENGDVYIEADSDHPINFKYMLDNTISVTAKEQLIIDTQKLKIDKLYDFTIEDMNVYKEGQLIE